MSTEELLNVPDELFGTNKFVRDFCFMGEIIGLSRADFADKIDLPLKSIEDPQAIVARQHIMKSYEVLVEFADDEFMGMGTSKLPRGTIDLIVRLACTVPTLKQALDVISQVLRISQGPLSPVLIVDNDIVCWRFNARVKRSEFMPTLVDTYMYILYMILVMLVKKDINLIKVNMSESKPSNTSDYDFLFPVETHFNQPHHELYFDKKWLQKPILCRYDEVKTLLANPINLRGYVHNSLGIVRQIKDILAAWPHVDFPNQKEIAERLGISIRTLQRKLEQEDSSYMKIKDDIRKRKALFYLQHTSKSLSTIAERCGFSELASFIRAFVRWTGVTPGIYCVKRR